MISKRGKCIATAFAILLLFGTVLLGAAFAGGRTEDAAHLAKESYIGSESLKGLTFFVSSRNEVSAARD